MKAWSAAPGASRRPTKFELFDPASGRTVDYLYTTTTNLDLSHYKGLRIIVTGEEGLDERWGNTPGHHDPANSRSSNNGAREPHRRPRHRRADSG